MRFFVVVACYSVCGPVVPSVVMFFFVCDKICYAVFSLGSAPFLFCCPLGVVYFTSAKVNGRSYKCSMYGNIFVGYHFNYMFIFYLCNLEYNSSQFYSGIHIFS